MMYAARVPRCNGRTLTRSLPLLKPSSLLYTKPLLVALIPWRPGISAAPLSCRMDAMAHILTVALNAAVDTTMTVPGPLKVGETHKVCDVLKLPGGKGLNVVRVLHTIGVPVHATGLAGGLPGEFIRSGLAQAGIDSSFLPIAGMSRTCIAVVECDSHRVTEVNEPGPTITDSEAQAFLDIYEKLLSGAEVVVLSGSLPPGLPGDYYR